MERGKEIHSHILIFSNIHPPHKQIANCLRPRCGRCSKGCNDQMSTCGENIPVLTDDGRFNPEKLHKGDLLFFGRRGEDGKPDKITHVGLYIGEGRMIHSSQLVRINSLIEGEADYYENAHRLLSATRIIGHGPTVTQ